MTFCEKMLTVHIYTIMRFYMQNLVKIGLLDFAVARVRTYIHMYIFSGAIPKRPPHAKEISFLYLAISSINSLQAISLINSLHIYTHINRVLIVRSGYTQT